MDLQKYTISPETPVRDAIVAIEKIGKKIVFVTNQSLQLLGIFSDGDMRRYILENGDLAAPISNAMNNNPTVFSSRSEVTRFMEREHMVAYPIVDKNRILTDVIFWNDNGINHPLEQFLEGIPIIIMAGGKGTRLYPYTKVLPKPLIPIGDLTITERIIHSFQKFGSKDYYMVLNYKRNMIKAYFNDLEKDYSVYYIDETEFLGTGGGLSLLQGKINCTFFVSNCDVLIDANYSDAYRFHKEQANKITFICALKNITIPYGVIHMTEDGKIDDIAEKPSFSFLTNTGVYLMEPDVLQELVHGAYIDLPDIAKNLLQKGQNVGVYPVSEKAWMDMGQFSEMEAMVNQINSDGGASL